MEHKKREEEDSRARRKKKEEEDLERKKKEEEEKFDLIVPKTRTRRPSRCTCQNHLHPLWRIVLKCWLTCIAALLNESGVTLWRRLSAFSKQNWRSKAHWDKSKSSLPIFKTPKPYHCVWVCVMAEHATALGGTSTILEAFPGNHILRKKKEEKKKKKRRKKKRKPCVNEWENTKEKMKAMYMSEWENTQVQAESHQSGIDGTPLEESCWSAGLTCIAALANECGVTLWSDCWSLRPLPETERTFGQIEKLPPHLKNFKPIPLCGGRARDSTWPDVKQ